MSDFNNPTENNGSQRTPLDSVFVEKVETMIQREGGQSALELVLDGTFNQVWSVLGTGGLSQRIGLAISSSESRALSQGRTLRQIRDNMSNDGGDIVQMS